MQALADEPTGNDRPVPAGIKILLADDHPLIIAGIRRTLDHVEDMEVVGEARTGEELLQLVERRGPDIVLMDFKMPGMHGVEMIERIRASWPEVKIVVLSASDERPTIDAALQRRRQRLRPQERAHGGHRLGASSGLQRRGLPRAGFGPSRSGADQGPVLPILTDRERSILSAVASGMTTSAISRDLWISEHTIKFHLTNIYRKLGVVNRAGAVRYALENGIV